MVITLKIKLSKNILYIIFVSRAKTRDEISTYKYKNSKKTLESIETYKTSRVMFKSRKKLSRKEPSIRYYTSLSWTTECCLASPRSVCVCVGPYKDMGSS